MTRFSSMGLPTSTVICTVLTTLLLVSAAPAQTRTASASTPDSAEGICAKLPQEDFATILDAPTQVTAARVIPASKHAPAHCEVEGYVQPNVGFVLSLPLTGWNGKFSQIGCGGFCGFVLASRCDAMVTRGYACIMTDMGHKSTPLDAKWALNNLQGELDFGFRATHVATLAGKALTQSFFARAPEHSYFLGCSTGGRQGYVEAQRYPNDYDGIVAGAPPISETGAGMALLWNVVQLNDERGLPQLGPAALQRIHAAAIASCDANDGLKDGLIGDPRACRFDPSELVCKSDASSDCLTVAQADAVRRVYRGPRDSKGRGLNTGGPLPGSELNWIGNYVSRDGSRSTYWQFMTDLFRYLAFMPDPEASWTPRDFDWDRDPKRLGTMEALFSGMNPDLRQYKAAAGKLISFQGWADQSVMPLNVINYYELTERTMGGRQATQQFYRLFMIPGMNHCTGGEGAHAVDYLSYLEAWVEQGKAPDMMLAAHPKSSAGFTMEYGSHLPDPGQIAFTRPLYPYPAVAGYVGHGDPGEADSFRPKSPP